MFLSIWDYIQEVEEDFSQFNPGKYQPHPIESKGYIQPYSDSPLDDEPVGENVYLNLIYQAKKYIHICTPYLIVDNEMVVALCAAAKAGVEVKIITPHKADKWYVHAVTRAYYPVLLDAGVQIYEYTPGFIHAKSFVVDGEYATVGTVNMDYRSLYLHFECGVWMYQTESIADMEQDYQETLSKSQLYTKEDCKTSWWARLGQSLLRLFAPLM